MENGDRVALLAPLLLYIQPNFKNKNICREIEKKLIEKYKRWKVEIESRCWLRSALYPTTSIPIQSLNTHGFKQIVDLLLSNPPPEFPGSLSTHAHSARRGDRKIKG